ncbi:MAG: RND transporter [Candidatus Omnitrophica bacterium CG11_big_fil_rev_8_21_14_0_20_42_13]|uniref:RND transporter n=1 Tax=Candidatus Ghiorseimicrobium undicola TaxID=1974746 RepID=A0A2H0LX27_9BACT|nr:MAG: RND transporter [Candidatus Omnitrophica bacterium CG11_big_fil_rev_8_21_14_0_20_42_13]
MFKNKIMLVVILAVVVMAGVFLFRARSSKSANKEAKEISPARGAIQSVISTTGTVLPKNRLEVKPPVGGRAEELLVKEGDKIKVGQTLAWISSTERAALLDAARGKGEEELKYWQDTYKAIPLISPIDGEVIVAKTQAGQTITTADAVVVLSDQLITRAQVDETDIGKVKEGQSAVITLDAYPDVKIKGAVEHIYYESKTVNNVTIYEVDVTPDEVPEFFRSGMNAAIDFKTKTSDNALLLPQEAVRREKDSAWVLVKEAGSKEPIKSRVELGISDDKNVEIISGLSEDDIVVVDSKKYELPKGDTGTNPFMPFRRRPANQGR